MDLSVVKQNTPENTAQEILAENSTEQPQEVAAITEEQPAVTETPDVSTIVNKTLQDFKTMYGGDAENINVSSVTQIAKTMNNMFLTK